MRSKAMKMFAYLAVVLMLFSVLPAGALAADNDDQSTMPRDVRVYSDDADQNMTRDQIRDRLNATENAPRAEAFVQNNIKTANQVKTNVANNVAQYRSAKERIVTVRNDYADAKKNFQDLRIKINNKKVPADSEEVAEITRAYMTRTIEYMITHLETVQENVENRGGGSADEISDTIDGYIEQLELQKENVKSAQTRQEFVNVAKEVRKIWTDAHKRAKFISCQSINKRLNIFLAKSEGISLRLESEINRLNAEGEDTEELEEMLAEYNRLIGEARQNQEDAQYIFQNRDGQNNAVNEVNQCLRQAAKNIQDANVVLKKMFNELKSHRRGSVVLAGIGTLTAEGDGTAVLSGDLTIDISATNARLVIKDLANNANVIIEGDYTEVNDNDDGDNNRALVYHNLTGTVHISGSRLTVMVHGDDISLTAEGKGSVILSGIGTYNVEKDGVSSGDEQWAVIVTPSADGSVELDSGSDGEEDEVDDGEADDGEADDGEADDGEADGGEADDGEADGGEADDGEADDGEADDGEADDGEADDESGGDDESDTQDNSTADGNVTEDDVIV